ncbi:MAG: hypothetical protein H0U95_05115 [Bacteroidetes bacterium]|nr:hypothetical protein [Bacteroidota bacterium]
MNKHLSWDDFRGKPEPRNSIASTHYDLIKKCYLKEDFATVQIVAVFFPSESWKRKKKDGVLIHEQKHFDIVELFARKLRKKIQEGSYTNYNDLIKKLEDLYRYDQKELDHYQNQYDRATNYSRNVRRQRKWNKRISDELNDLSNYKDNTFIVNFQPKVSSY